MRDHGTRILIPYPLFGEMMDWFGVGIPDKVGLVVVDSILWRCSAKMVSFPFPHESNRTKAPGSN